jgi:hypothetical protein
MTAASTTTFTCPSESLLQRLRLLPSAAATTCCCAAAAALAVSACNSCALAPSLSLATHTLNSNGTIHEADFKALEKNINSIIKAKQPFVRLSLTKAEALEMFKVNTHPAFCRCDR